MEDQVSAPEITKGRLQSTKVRHSIRRLRNKDIDLEKFKFPPTTPKPQRPLAWSVGSGFQSITLNISHSKRSLYSHRRNLDFRRPPPFKTTSVKPLELSADLWPYRDRSTTNSSSLARGNASYQSQGYTATRRNDVDQMVNNMVECESPAIFDEVRNLTTLLRQRNEPYR